MSTTTEGVAGAAGAGAALAETGTMVAMMPYLHVCADRQQEPDPAMKQSTQPAGHYD